MYQCAPLPQTPLSHRDDHCIKNAVSYVFCMQTLLQTKGGESMYNRKKCAVLHSV